MLKSVLENTFDGMRGENKFLRIITAGLLVAIFAQTCSNASRDEIITVVPPTLTEKSWVSRTESSSTYTEAWALYISMLIGNVTPSNASVIKDALGPVLSADIYQDVMKVLDDQIHLIRQDRMSLSFEAEKVMKDTNIPNRYYITGRSVAYGPTGDRNRTNRTYEVDIVIKDYRPRIEWISTYTGQPRSADVIAREQALQERQERLATGSK